MSLSTHKYLKDISGKSEAELRHLVGELKKQQFEHRFERAMGALSNYRSLQQAKRKLAVVLTLLRERQLASELGADWRKKGGQK